MWLEIRLFFAALLVGAVLTQGGLAFVSDANAASMMVMPEDCRPNDCADTPDCDAACLATSECRVVPYATGLGPAVLLGESISVRTAFSTAAPTSPRQHSDDGLQRPPMA